MCHEHETMREILLLGVHLHTKLYEDASIIKCPKLPKIINLVHTLDITFLFSSKSKNSSLLYFLLNVNIYGINTIVINGYIFLTYISYFINKCGVGCLGIIEH